MERLITALLEKLKSLQAVMLDIQLTKEGLRQIGKNPTRFPKVMRDKTANALKIICVSVFTLLQTSCLGSEEKEASYAALIRGGYANPLSYQVRVGGEEVSLSFSKQSDSSAVSSLFALKQEIAAHLSTFPEKKEDKGYLLLKGTMLDLKNGIAEFKLTGWGVVGKPKVTKRVQADNPIEVDVVQKDKLHLRDIREGERFDALSEEEKTAATKALLERDEKRNLSWVGEKPTL